MTPNAVCDYNSEYYTEGSDENRDDGGTTWKRNRDGGQWNSGGGTTKKDMESKTSSSFSCERSPLSFPIGLTVAACVAPKKCRSRRCEGGRDVGLAVRCSRRSSSGPWLLLYRGLRLVAVPRPFAFGRANSGNEGSTRRCRRRFPYSSAYAPSSNNSINQGGGPGSGPLRRKGGSGGC